MFTVEAVDYHTGGEPFRIVTPQREIRGTTVGDRRLFAMSDRQTQSLRKLLCFEPRGHADMYGGLIVPADDEGAHFGSLFWHKDGFSTTCGHGTIALGVWAVQTKLVAIDPSGVTEVRIDVPSGRVTARVHTDGDQVTSADFINVPSYVLLRDVPVTTTLGVVPVDIVSAGALFAHLKASDVGLEVNPGRYSELISAGREIRNFLNTTDLVQHPTDKRLDGIYAVVIYDDLGVDQDGNPEQRNITVFADGQVDRSPCGAGTASRVANLADSGQLTDHNHLVHQGIVGTVFRARVVGRAGVGAYSAVIPEVSGTAFRTAHHVFELDPADTLAEGFVLR